MKKNRLLVSALSMCLVLAQMPIGAFAAVPDNAQAVLTGGGQPKVIERSVLDDADIQMDSVGSEDSIIIEENNHSRGMESIEETEESENQEISAIKAGSDKVDSLAADQVITENLGSDLSPTPISNAAELMSISNSPVGNYVLTTDIDLTQYQNWTPIGSSAGNQFKGNFDGAGHTITFGEVSGSSVDYFGLFGYAEDSTIVDLHVVTNITGGNTVGGLVGYAKNCVIKSCSTEGTVTGTADIGGLAGYTNNSTIQNCYSRAEVISTSADSKAGVGGLVGEQYASSVNSIITSYAAGRVQKQQSSTGVGGLVGIQSRNQNASSGFYYGSNRIVDCFYDREQTGTSEKNRGFAVESAELKDQTNLYGWDFDNIWKIDSQNDGYPHLIAGGVEKTWSLSGTGKTDDPYLITTGEELAALARNEFGSNNFSACYKLTNDIVVDGNYWYPIGGNWQDEFSGTFDGDGHTISGITINYPGYEYEGLFGTVSGTVKNLDVQVDIKEAMTAGGLAGSTNGATIEACSSTGSISGTADIGGLVGYMKNGMVRNSYSTVNVTSSSNNANSGVGGLVGEQYTSTQARIVTSYAAGRVQKEKTTSGVGGLVGIQNRSQNVSSGIYYGNNQIIDCYYSAGTGQQDIRGFCIKRPDMKKQTTFTYWDFTNTWAMEDGVNDGYPYLKRSAEYKPIKMRGLGTSVSPYKISTEYELASIARDENGVDNFTAFYKLENDIELTSDYWTPIAGNGMGNFSGSFDGDGHTISGITINYAAFGYEGLFGSVNGTIRNLNVQANINDSYTAGALAGYTEDATIEACSSSGTIKGSNRLGGLVGYMYKGLVRNCYSVADVTSYSDNDGIGVGGLVGEQYTYTEAKIVTSYAAGHVSKEKSSAGVGGLVGIQSRNKNASSGAYYGTHPVIDCFYDTETSGASDTQKGFGVSSDVMKDISTYPYWDFTNIWGIDKEINNGYPYLKITGDYMKVEPEGTGTQMDPYLITKDTELAAMARGELSLSAYYELENDIILKGDYWTPISANQMPKFTGQFDGAGHTISGIKVTGKGYGYSGLFGWVDGTICNLRVSGELTDVYSGGMLAGVLEGNGKIYNCCSVGSIQGAGSYAGGLIAFVDNANVNNCYSRVTVSITGNGASGGLIGHAYVSKDITHDKLYATGTVDNNNPANMGGLIGATSRNRNASSGIYYGSLTITNSYFDNYDNGVTGRGTYTSTEDMKKTETYTGWDFDNTWSISADENDGYPQLQIFAGKAIPVPTVVDVTGVTLNKTELSLEAGKSQTLVATVAPANATNTKVTWSSSDETVATVSQAGKVTAVAEGTATITVTTEDGGKKATCALTVTKAAGTTAVKLNKNTLTLQKEKDETLTLTFTPEDTTDKEVSFSSSDATIASVDQNGKVTAVKAGKATITVKLVSDETVTDSCEVTVTDDEIKPTAITLSKTTLSLDKGKDATLTVTFTPEDATDTEVVWSSSKEAVATVDQTGKVKGVTAGSAVITATLKSDDTIKAECTVTVKEGSSEPEPGPGPEPETDVYNVTFYVGEEKLKQVSVDAGDSIYDVMPETSEVLGLIPEGTVFAGWYIDGTSTLWDITSPVNRYLILEARYISTNNGSSTDQGSGRDPQIIKEDGTSTVVSATYYYDVYMVQGQTYTFPVKYGEIDSTLPNASSKIKWVSSDKNYITISGSYKAKAVKETPVVKEDDDNGHIYVSDTNDPATSNYVYDVHIVSPVLKAEGEQAQAKTKNLVKGNTLNLQVTGLGDYEDLYDVTWYTSNAEIARVDDGLVTAEGKGTAKISAFVNGKAYTCSVKVADFEKPDKIINESAVTLTPLQTAALKFNVSGFKAKNLKWTTEDDDDPLKAYDKNGVVIKPESNGVKYYQNSVVRITPAGKVTAVGTGETTVLATDASGKNIQITFRVPKPSTGIIYINKGKKKSIKPYNVNVKAANWNYGSFEDTKCIDLIASNGSVKGKAYGKATVTCGYDPYHTGREIVYTTTVFVEDPKLDTSDTSKWVEANATGTIATLNLKNGENFVIKVNGVAQPVVFVSNKTAIAFVDEAGVVHARGKGNADLNARVNGAKLLVKVKVTE